MASQPQACSQTETAERNHSQYSDIDNDFNKFIQLDENWTGNGLDRSKRIINPDQASTATHPTAPASPPPARNASPPLVTSRNLPVIQPPTLRTRPNTWRCTISPTCSYLALRPWRTVAGNSIGCDCGCRAQCSVRGGKVVAQPPLSISMSRIMPLSSWLFRSIPSDRRR